MNCFFRFCLYTALAVGAFAPLPAQIQPLQAVNQQDEVVQIQRPVDKESESFKILRSGDKAEINRYVTKVYPLRNANPYEMLPYLRSIAALEKGSVVTASIPGEGGTTQKWIQVNVPDFQIPSIDAAVSAYDVPNFISSQGDIKFSYRTKYRNAVEVADFIRISTLSPDGNIRADLSTNTIYVQDSPSDFKRVLAQIQFYDIPVPQIDMEVTLIQLTNTDQTSLGLDWDAWKTSLSGKGNFNAISTHEEPATGGELNSHLRQFNGLLSLDAAVLARFLNYLTDTGKATILARTNLTVSNGRAGQIISGSQIPEFNYVFNKDQAASNLQETPAPTNDPSAEGIAIAITPVIAMNAARMDVRLAARSPIAVSKSGGTIYGNEEILADFTLAQDQLYKVGGLRRKVQAKERKGFPLLKEIPVIKYLFSNETTILRDTELYLFVKPTWTAPLLPVRDGMQADNPVEVPRVTDILRENPNLAISDEDMALLEKYFAARRQ